MTEIAKDEELEISEYHLYKIVEDLFLGYIIFPPSTVKSIDFLVAYTYKAVNQLRRYVFASKRYPKSWIIAIAPMPNRISKAVAPILYFFKMMDKYGSK